MADTLEGKTVPIGGKNVRLEPLVVVQSGLDSNGKPVPILVSSTGGTTGLTDTQLRATPVPVSRESVTPHFKALTASGSQVIPIGAKGWSATILTGTGTIGGEAAPAGLSIGDDNTLLATVTIATNNPGTAFVTWNT